MTIPSAAAPLHLLLPPWHALQPALCAHAFVRVFHYIAVPTVVVAAVRSVVVLL